MPQKVWLTSRPVCEKVATCAIGKNVRKERARKRSSMDATKTVCWKTIQNYSKNYTTNVAKNKQTVYESKVSIY